MSLVRMNRDIDENDELNVDHIDQQASGPQSDMALEQVAPVDKVLIDNVQIMDLSYQPRKRDKQRLSVNGRQVIYQDAK